MRQIAAIVVGTAVLAVPQAAAKTGIPPQLLGFVGQGKTLAVAKLDPLTLKPVSRRAVIGTSTASFVARVAGGGRAAFATDSAAIRFLNFDTMRWEFRIAYPGRPSAALWNYANKLVTLDQLGSVIIVDPTQRRLGAFRPLGGSLAAFAVTRDRIIALVAPLDGIGPSKLAVIDDSGRVRSVPLPQIHAGSEILNNASLLRYRWPGLAVNGNRAVVIGADGTIADVELDTLAATARTLTRSLANVRKHADGSTRTARFVASDVIAVTGGDASFDGTTQRSSPAGLTLIDTRDWSTRRLDAETRGIAPSGFGPACVACGGVVVVAYGSNGLVGYDTNGTLKFRLFPGKPAPSTFVAGAYAYVGGATHFTIVDTWTGKVVRTVDTALPTYFAPMLLY